MAVPLLLCVGCSENKKLVSRISYKSKDHWSYIENDYLFIQKLKIMSHYSNKNFVIKFWLFNICFFNLNRTLTSMHVKHHNLPMTNKSLTRLQCHALSLWVWAFSKFTSAKYYMSFKELLKISWKRGKFVFIIGLNFKYIYCVNICIC